GVVVVPDDLTQVIYCLCGGDAACVQGFFDGRKDAAAQEEAVRVAVIVQPNDLACIVDAEGCGVRGCQRLLNRREDIDWHVFSSPPDTVLVSASARHSEAARPMRADLRR